MKTLLTEIRRWRMKQILKKIWNSDDVEIVAILNQIFRRYKERYPETEPVFLTLPKQNIAECKRILDLLLSTLGN